MEFSGRLASFPIAELLQWAHNDCRTGSLVLRRSSREKRIYFEEGRIVGCLTDQTSEFYGQHLLLGGHISQEQLLKGLTLCREEGKRLGVVLEEKGFLKRQEVRKTLRQHIEDLICDIFLWRHGVFFFRSEAAPREEILADAINTVGIAFEGARWSDEYGRIRHDFEHDDIVLRRIDRGTAGTAVPATVRELGPRAVRIFHEVEGERTLEQIHGRVQGSYFRFLAMAHDMFNKGLLEVGAIYEEGGITSVELSVQDVIFEQAAAEHMRASRRHMSSPLGDLERFVPIWVRKPPEEEWNRMPGEVRDFYRRLDGTRRLNEIFSKDEKEWNRQSDLLMLQLAKERVALLPAPLAELSAADGEPTAEEERWWDALHRR